MIVKVTGELQVEMRMISLITLNGLAGPDVIKQH